MAAVIGASVEVDETLDEEGGEVGGREKGVAAGKSFLACSNSLSTSFGCGGSDSVAWPLKEAP